MAGGGPLCRSPTSPPSGEPGDFGRDPSSSPARRESADAGIATCSSGAPSNSPDSLAAACCWVSGPAGCTPCKGRGSGDCMKPYGRVVGTADNAASPVGQTAAAAVGSPPAAAENLPGTAGRVPGCAVECDPTAVRDDGKREAAGGSLGLPGENADLTAEDDGSPEGRNATTSNSTRKGKRRTDVENDKVLRRSPRTIAKPLKIPPVVAKNGGPRRSVEADGKSTAQASAENRSLRRSPRTFSCYSESAADAARTASSVDNVRSRYPKKAKISSPPKKGTGKKGIHYDDVFFIGDPVPEEEARSRWPHHYVQLNELQKKDKITETLNELWKARDEVGRSNGRIISSKGDEDEIVLGVKCHYYQASIVGSTLDLGDCAYVKAEEGKPNYVGRILEFFETIDGDYYFTVQWFFRAEDTVIKEQAKFLDKRRLFYSDLRNDNLLDCIVSKVNVVQVSPNVDMKPKRLPACDFYYDMKFSVEYSSFYRMANDDLGDKSDLTSYNCSEIPCAGRKDGPVFKDLEKHESAKSELSLLDLYSGCGGMSTGLCLGAHDAGVDVVTRWAVDVNDAACKALKLNHPETKVWNESGDDFFALLKEWEVLCKRFVVRCDREKRQSHSLTLKNECHNMSSHDYSEIPDGEYEVSSLVGICYGDPSNTGKRGLKFKVRWKGYGEGEDTWEPIEGLSKCQDRIKEFVRTGFKSKILPLPGDVDVVCGGPPCQGISGLNRHRNVDSPLDDEKNQQIVVFLDIIKFLKPKYVLMENVVDILKFASGTLGRYALGRLVSMNYQARLGIMAAGCYGLPQFRLRAFFWGCHPYEKLPAFPLPTHEVILKGGAPSEFERNVVAYDEDQPRMLEKAFVLEDVISDLPTVTCYEVRDQMPYERAPQTDFQRYIRAAKCEIMGLASNVSKNTRHSVLYDHCPLPLSEDNYLRVCKIPRRKGACFRDLPGVAVQPDNSVQFEATIERVLLPSGNPLVPDYVIKFEKGKSTRAFGRLWWDEVVSTVFTTAEPHYQAVIHPQQDRVLTVRENARLQGFPDYYRFYGTIKERYRQIGNAVAIPVGRALGYTLGMAWLKQSGEEPLMTLPPKFSHSHIPQHQASSSSEVQE